MKQVPLVFLVMSGKANYDTVFRTVLDQLPTVSVVGSITADFVGATVQCFAFSANCVLGAISKNLACR